MTMPRWWDNRFMLGLVLTTLVLGGIVHLWSFAPGGVPGVLYWAFLLCWLVVTLGQFLLLRYPRSQSPVPPPVSRRSFWPQSRAEFTTGPRWLRLFNWGQALLMGYLLLSFVLLVADPHNFGLRVTPLLAANQCLIWLRIYATALPAPVAGRVA